MEQYTVTGMSCAACSARVEKAVSAVPGVTSCSVSLLTNSMGVEGTADPTAIVCAVEAAGYGAAKAYGGSGRDGQPASGGTDANTAADDYARLRAEEDALIDRETPKMLRCLISSIAVLLVLMYFSMGHNMWGFPVPEILDNAVSLGLIEMLLTIIIDPRRRYLSPRHLW